MPVVMEQIDRLSAAEKLETVDYILSSLSRENVDVVPKWHSDELRATELRVATGVERPISWEAAKSILRQLA